MGSTRTEIMLAETSEKDLRTKMQREGYGNLADVDHAQMMDWYQESENIRRAESQSDDND